MVGIAAGLAGIVVVVTLVIITGQEPVGPVVVGPGPTADPSRSAPAPLSHLHTKALQHASSAPLDIAAATDGTAWFTEFENNKIGHVTVAGDIREFAS